MKFKISFLFFEFISIFDSTKSSLICEETFFSILKKKSNLGNILLFEIKHVFLKVPFSFEKLILCYKFFSYNIFDLFKRIWNIIRAIKKCLTTVKHFVLLVRQVVVTIVFTIQLALTSMDVNVTILLVLTKVVSKK